MPVVIKSHLSPGTESFLSPAFDVIESLLINNVTWTHWWFWLKAVPPSPPQPPLLQSTPDRYQWHCSVWYSSPFARVERKSSQCWRHPPVPFFYLLSMTSCGWSLSWIMCALLSSLPVIGTTPSRSVFAKSNFADVLDTPTSSYQSPCHTFLDTMAVFNHLQVRRDHFKPCRLFCNFVHTEKCECNSV